MVYRDVRDWLHRRYGLVRGHPSETLVAEQEIVVLPEFFVSVAGYEQLQDLKSRIVFAPNGYGKSALRIMFANYLEANTTSLAIAYTKFDIFSKNSKPTLRQHVRHLLKLAVKQLLAYLSGTQGNVSAGMGLGSLSAEQREMLGAFIHTYAKDLYAPQYLYPIFQQMSSNKGVSWRRFEACVKANALETLLDVNEHLAANPTARFWADVVAQRFMPLDVDGSPLETLKTFADFTKGLGLSGIYFLVDGFVGSPVAQIDFLESLFAPLGLFDIEGVDFGFFLTTCVWEELQRCPFWCNGIEAVAVTQAWRDTHLRELLRLRLLVYSDGKLPSFSLLCNAKKGYVKASNGVGLQPFPDFLETLIIEKANGSPRRLLKLLNALLLVHFRRYPYESFILEQGLDEQDWALIQPYMESILADDAPPTIDALLVA